ncbi:MAG: cytidylyltransferase domain-containing protein [Bacillota bacterium]
MPEYGIIITVRSKSSRLPGKAWHKLQGKPVIYHLVERVKQIRGYRQVIIATTNLPEDRAFGEVAEKYSVGIFYGHPTDVLQRQMDAANAKGIEFYVTADGDDLFCDFYCYEKLLENYLCTQADYIKPEGFIIGTYAYGIKVAALEKICRLKDDLDTEGFGRYFEQLPGFKLSIVKNSPGRFFPDLRLTIDYPDDMKLIETLVEKINKPVKSISTEDIIDACRENPEMIGINSHMDEVYWKNFKKKYSSIKLREEALQ